MKPPPVRFTEDAARRQTAAACAGPGTVASAGDMVVFLVRHAAHGMLGRVLTGRMPGVHLSPAGHCQARRLGAALAGRGIAAVQSSPRERAVETAAAIAEACRCVCEECAALDEIDLGDWTGRAFDELEGDPRWRAWNARRSRVRAPGGESMAEVGARVIGHIRLLARNRPPGPVVLVSHADVIKTAILALSGASLDAVPGLEVAPASVSTLIVTEGRVFRVLCLNERVAP